MIKNVSTSDNDTRICVGGDCCVPSAVRKKAKTIRIRVKLVITKINEGASTSSVMMMTILSVVTSSLGLLGALRERSIFGIGGGAGISTSGVLVISCVCVLGVAWDCGWGLSVSISGGEGVFGFSTSIM